MNRLGACEFGGVSPADPRSHVVKPTVPRAPSTPYNSFATTEALGRIWGKKDGCFRSSRATTRVQVWGWLPPFRDEHRGAKATRPRNSWARGAFVFLGKTPPGTSCGGLHEGRMQPFLSKLCSNFLCEFYTVRGPQGCCVAV